MPLMRQQISLAIVLSVTPHFLTHGRVIVSPLYVASQYSALVFSHSIQPFILFLLAFHHYLVFNILTRIPPWKLECSGSDGKASVCNAGDLGSIPGLGRPPGEGNSSPLQYYCLENSMNPGAWDREESYMTQWLILSVCESEDHSTFLWRGGLKAPWSPFNSGPPIRKLKPHLLFSVFR